MQHVSSWGPGLGFQVYRLGMWCVLASRYEILVERWLANVRPTSCVI